MSEQLEIDPPEEDIAEVKAAVVRTRERESPAMKDLREQEDQELVDYLQSLAGESGIRVQVWRKLPKMHQGKPIEGMLETFDEPISEYDIREQFGGGKYEVKVMRPDQRGRYKYVGQRTIKIAGDPVLTSHHTESAASVNEEPTSVVQQALRMTSEATQRAEDRARRAEERAMSQPAPQFDATPLRVLSEQINGLQRALLEKDKQLIDIMNRKPEPTQESTLLHRLVDGESARVTAIRTQVESEIRTLQARHDAEIDRVNNRLDEDRRRSDDAHRRELDAIKSTYEQQVRTLQSALDSQLSVQKISYEGQIEGYKREIIHLDRELTATKTELAELRARKDKGMTEVLTELAAVKEAMDGFAGGEEKESGGTIDRIISAAGPLVEGIATRLASGPGAPPALPEATTDPFAGMPIGQPVQLPDGRVLMKRPTGEVVQIKRRGAPTPKAPGEEEELQLDPGEVAAAVAFMEGAVKADTDPVTFANTARNMVPAQVLAALRTKGVDYFLNNVAKLETHSPLLTQKGKNWARKVAATLIGD